MRRPKIPAKFPWLPAATFLFIFAAVATGGYLFYSLQLESIKAEKHEDLESIAGLKAQQISRWLQERSGDATVLSKSPLLARNVARWFDNPNHPDAGLHTRTRLEAMLAYDMYQSIILCDAKGKVRKVFGRNHLTALGTNTMEKLRETAGAGRVLFSDFYQCDLDGEVHLDVFAPLLDGGKATAVVILRIDPGKYLFPLIQSWPLPRKSAETLILRREGDSVLFLNDLRHRERAAMKFRLPLADTMVPAVRAALGHEGLVEGPDYRGEPVLADVRRISDSPWYMVAKVDQEEIYRPIRLAAVILTGAGLLLVLLAGSVIGLLWQRRQKHLYGRLLETERQRQALVMHYEYLTKYANDYIFVLDDKRRIVEVNDRVAEDYGYTRDELLTMTADQIRAGDQNVYLEGQLQDAVEKNGTVYETLHRRRDGTTFTVEVSARPIEIEGKVYLQGIVRDITERKRAEEAITNSLERERFLGNIIRAASVAIGVGYPDGRLGMCNPAFQELTGYSEEELKTIAWNTVLTPPEWLDSEMQALAELHRTKRPVVYEKVYIHKSGKRTPIELVVHPFFDAGGEVSHYYAFITDITDRKAAQEKLQTAHEELQASYEEIEANNQELHAAEEELQAQNDKLIASEEQLKQKNEELTAAEEELRQQNDELRNNKEALAASEMRYRRLFESAKDGILILDAETGRIDDANPFIKELLGYLREELMGMELWEIGLFKDIVASRESFVRLQQNGYVRYEDMPLQTKDGDRRDVEFVSNVYQVGDRKVVQCNIRDITERKRAEADLLRSKQELDKAQRIGNIGNWVWDIANDKLKWSDELYRIWGIEPQASLTFEGIEAVIHPEDREANARLVDSLLTDESPLISEFRIVRPDGEVRHIHQIIEVTRNADGRAARAFGTMQDITERKWAEEALRTSEERFRTFFENTFVGIYRTTPDGRILMANPALVRMLGYGSFEELAERDLEKCGYEPDYSRDEFKQLMSSCDQVIGYEAQWKRRDGSTIWLRENARAVRDSQGELQYYEGTVENINLQKIAEAAKEQAEEELRQAQKLEAIGQLAGGVAHDFNNMLAGIMGNAELLMSKLAGEPELARHVEQILSGAEHAAKLTRQLLNFSRKGSLQRTVVDVHRIIGETAGILANTIDRRIAVEQHLRASPSTVMGDHSQLENAFLNLGLNSRDAMPNGGRLIFSTETTVLDGEYLTNHHYKIIPGRYLKIEVTDTGSGMDAATKAKIFEPFFTTKEQGKGTGLGLASAYGTVKSHGGSIECYSEPGYGTTMKIYLPVCEQGQHAENAHNGDHDIDPAGPGGGTILVADDEELVRGLTEQVLRANGFEVLVANDGEEAVQVYQAWHGSIDLVILDMIMPRMSGREAFLEMKKIDPGVRAVLASGFSEDGEAREMLKLGFSAFVQKPFRVAELLAAVSRALREK